MPKFELFRPDGSLEMNLASRLTKFLGSVSINLNQSGSLVNPDLLIGTPWYVCFSEADNFSQGSYVPNITFSGDTMTWTRTSSGTAFFAGTILYGVYSNGQN